MTAVSVLATRPSAAVSSGFRSDIQGLRAVAVMLVVLGHAGVPGLGGGYIGVDVFFVISGYLITCHLLTELERHGRIRLGRFYVRRARRILPAALAVLVLTVVASLALVPPLRLPEILKDAAATALWVPNVRFAIDKTDYLSGSAPSPLQHYWSLGVEEQFYLFWPLLLLLIFVLARRSKRMLGLAVAVLAVLSFAACLLVSPVAQPVAFFSLPTRAWELAVGGVVVFLVPLARRLAGGHAAPLAGVVGWIGLAATIGGALLLGTEPGTETAYPGVATLVPVLGTALVILAGSAGAAPGRSVGRLLAVRPLQYLGRISFSLYLVHWPLLVVAHERLGLATPLPSWLGVALALVAVPLAAALYAGVESPLRLSSGSSARSTPLLAVAIPTVIAVALLATVLVVESNPLRSNRAAGPTAITAPPTATDFVPRDLAPTLAGAAADTGALYKRGCQQTLGESEPLRCTFGDRGSPVVMVLFGDSHAGRWASALDEVARARGIRLETYTKSGCRSEERDSLWDDPANRSCTQWRKNVVARLSLEKPDVIVLTNHLGPTSPSNDGAVQADWERAATSTMERLPAASRVITIADTPQFPASPPDCLSAHLADTSTCSIPRETAFSTAISSAQSTVAARTGSGFVDLSDFFCSPTTCAPIIGSTLVYSDEHHMTATFSRLLAPALDAALAPYLSAG
ncbi:acyltransferase [Glaciihabitans sp. INWT7]|uniref:acyltransferase family protein n=1 Tax=Glaciihabitans sp. INWT7 TaxID=2596912 RepID=UPI001626E866|nr:acyltransferase family protein [Glaciihabitans sp. INWT7]QNE46282.1 acyltransferase [Glaciihabitans sp. INWT7]